MWYSCACLIYVSVSLCSGYLFYRLDIHYIYIFILDDMTFNWHITRYHYFDFIWCMNIFIFQLAFILILLLLKNLFIQFNFSQIRILFLGLHVLHFIRFSRYLIEKKRPFDHWLLLYTKKYSSPSQTQSIDKYFFFDAKCANLSCTIKSANIFDTGHKSIPWYRLVYHSLGNNDTLSNGHFF